jgi:hypothetical protein
VILGHASIATTADVYGHLTDAMLGRAAERTDVILGRPAGQRLEWYDGWYIPNRKALRIARRA